MIQYIYLVGAFAVALLSSLAVRRSGHVPSRRQRETLIAAMAAAWIVAEIEGRHNLSAGILGLDFGILLGMLARSPRGGGGNGGGGEDDKPTPDVPLLPLDEPTNPQGGPDPDGPDSPDEPVELDLWADFERTTGAPRAR